MSTKTLPYKDNLDRNFEQLFTAMSFRKQDNGKAGNHDAQVVAVLFAEAMKDVQVYHNLGRAAEGYIVIGSDKATVVFDGTIPATDKYIVLQSVIGPATVRLLII